MATPNQPPLAPGWTEHKAPTGHSYYYNAATKNSTYTRPVAPPSSAAGLRSTYSVPPPPPAHPVVYPQPFSVPNQGAPFQQPFPQQNLPQNFPARPIGPFPNQSGSGGRGRGGHGFRGGHQGPRRNPPPPKRETDKPHRKRKIPGAEPWLLVTTKAGRKFVFNPETKTSLWTAPKEVQEKIDELPEKVPVEERREDEERRLRRRREKREMEIRAEQEELMKQNAAGMGVVEAEEEEEEEEEEGEEGETLGDANTEQPAKRVKLDPSTVEDYEYEDQPVAPAGPVEMTEEDIEWQLQAMAEEYGLDEEDLHQEDEEDLTYATETFYQLLVDLQISPYKTWEQILPLIVEDERYTALPNTRARKDAFIEWCKIRVAQIKEEEKNKKKEHPKTVFWTFLKSRSTGKLYWTEFKRKWRKEPEMKSSELLDKDREKMYRDFVARMKTSASIRESDFKQLLKSTPDLNRNLSPLELPDSVTTDVRYVVCPEETRGRIIDEHLRSLPEMVDLTGESVKEARGAQALREREMAVRRKKGKLNWEAERAREILRAEEEEIERAKMVDRRGLASQLKGDGTGKA